MAEAAERFEIRGLVQGVFYRKWAQANAQGLGLRGWVRNRPDGSVEALFAGPQERLAAFAEAALAGPPDARVDTVERFAAEAPDGEGVVIAEDG
ncbi:MAG: acylphosphatase [Ancylobacter novellus]|uniref:acylphosphatase n=1 Tax=Ancylobacter novellus TaxID=921 RepID=A0A2W5K6F1_ANCNO|nr:MAG: acylphosphatase [Ancylobacter novellus]